MKIKQIITPLLILCVVLVGCTVRAAQPTETHDNKKDYPNLSWHTGLRFPATPQQIEEWIK